jgi:hypothetical protein
MAAHRAVEGRLRQSVAAYSDPLRFCARRPLQRQIADQRTRKLTMTKNQMLKQCTGKLGDAKMTLASWMRRKILSQCSNP